MSYSPDSRCMWCGETYEKHEGHRAAGAPVPKMPCLGLKSAFRLKPEPKPSEPEPLCGGCSHTFEKAVSNSEPLQYVECAVCRNPTACRAPREVVVGILQERLERLKAT